MIEIFSSLRESSFHIIIIPTESLLIEDWIWDSYPKELVKELCSVILCFQEHKQERFVDLNERLTVPAKANTISILHIPDDEVYLVAHS